MRTALIVALAVALAAIIMLPAATASGAAAATKPARPDAGRFTVGIDYWDTSGDAGFVVSGAMPEWGYWGRWRSQLEYDLDVNYAAFTIAYALPTPRVPLGFRVQYATGDADGLTIDTDWEHPADPSRWLRTESDTEADADLWSIDVGWWLSFGGSHPERGVELFAGYWHHTADFVDDNIRILEDPYDLYAWDTYVGRISTYNIEVEAARLGARTELPIASKVSIGAELAVLLGTARGEGNWLLREYTFQHEADGTGFDITLAVRYSPIPNLTIQAGGRYLQFEGEKGTEDGQQPAYEYVEEGILDEISIDQLGWFLGVSYEF